MREPREFELRCASCRRIRDREFYQQSPHTTCVFCLRKAERIAEGLFTIGGSSSRSSGVRSQRRRQKFDDESALAAMQAWKTERRVELADEGIMYGDAAAVMAQEEPAVRQKLGMQ